MSSSDSPTDEKRRSWIYILLALLLVCGCVALVAGPGRPLILGFLSGGDDPTETPTPPVTCGDGQCSADAGEDCTTCSQDCGECQTTCGDDVCDTEAGEDCDSCSQDCGECQTTCGDDVCDTEAGEDCDSCSQDCGECQTSCGDDVCNRDAGEDCQTCDKDCGACPPGNTRGACLDPCDPANSTCQAGLACVPESTSSSSQYICWSQAICNVTSVPPCNNNGVCESGEVTSCPDCQQDPCVCGDGVCEQARCNELQQNCPADCGVPDPCAGSFCGDGVCRPECGDNQWTCSDCYTP